MYIMGILLVFHLSFFITAGKSEKNINIVYGKKAFYRVEEKVSEVVLSEESFEDFKFQYLIVDLSSLNWIIDMTMELSGQSMHIL